MRTSMRLSIVCLIILMASVQASAEELKRKIPKVKYDNAGNRQYAYEINLVDDAVAKGIACYFMKTFGKDE